jgi:hypothetical protein
VSVVEAVEIFHARLQLEVAVDALTIPGKEGLGDGWRAEVMPPLLFALEDAQTANTARATARRCSRRSEAR